MKWISPALNEEAIVRLNALEPGIPSYMRESVADWAVEALGGDYLNDGYVTYMGLEFKTTFPKNPSSLKHKLASSSDSLLVSVLDWQLFYLPQAKNAWEDLEFILDTGKSEWAVTTLDSQEPRVTKRVPEGVLTILTDLVDRTSAAGQLLAEAFNTVHGTNPNPNHAYDLSVKAVETIACPKYLPGNSRATLGSVYAHLSQKSVALPMREAGVPDKELIVSMMRKLFLGAERHGSDSYEHVSLDGAKAALALATALLSMIHEDTITIS